MQTSRRVLPPGIEDDVVFGILWIKLISLKTTKIQNTPPATVQFWGEPTPASLPPLSPLEYEIKCPITLFSKYLLDMGSNLRVEVQGLGVVPMDLSCHLKQNIGIETKSPFDHLQGFFPVVDSKNKKVASLQLELCCTFNPDIALRELTQEEEEKQGTTSPTITKPSKERKPKGEVKGKGKEPQESKQGLRCLSCGCEEGCRCPSMKVNSLDVLAVEKPDLFCEFYQESKQKKGPTSKAGIVSPVDNRIANSLNNEPNKATFQPTKYEPVNTPTKKSFPVVEKVLTYSNLRLDKEQEEGEDADKGKRQKPKEPTKEEKERELVREKREPEEEKKNWKGLGRPEKQQLSPQIPLITVEEEQKKTKKEVKGELGPVQIKQILPMREEPVQAIKSRADRQEQQERGLPKEEVSLSQVSEVRKVNDSASLQAKKEILSRVVNLDQELHKQRNQYQVPLREVKPLPNVFSVGFKPLPNLGRKPVKKSGLLLSMVVEIERSSVVLPASRFWIRFRPYGEKEFLKIGPDFEPTITLIFPVSEPQVLKMNKIPFLLEFWGGDQQLLGLVKLPLSKVHQGFVLDGRLNEVAVKTSLTPTVVQKGLLAVKDLSDAVVGQINLSAYIGTTAQLQTHLSSPKAAVSQKLPLDPVGEVKVSRSSELEKKEQRAKRRSAGQFSSLSCLLKHIIESPERTKVLLSGIAGKESLDETMFESLLDSVGFEGDTPYPILQRAGTVQSAQLLLCLQDYQAVIVLLQNKMALEAKRAPKEAIELVISRIHKHQRLNLIEKSAVSQMPEVARHLPTLAAVLPQLAAAQQLASWLSSPHHPHPPILLTHQPAVLQAATSLVLQGGILQQVQGLLERADTAGLVLFDELGKLQGEEKFSIWVLGVLLEGVYGNSGEKYEGQGRENTKVNAVLLYNWLIHHATKEQEIDKQDEEEHIKSTSKIQSPEALVKGPIEDQEEVQPVPVEDFMKEKESPSIEVPQPLHPTISERQPTTQMQTGDRRQPIVQHTFVVGLLQLQLNQVEAGPCHLQYQFPLEEEPIPHSAIQLQADKHSYNLWGQSSHSLTLSHNIVQHLADHPLVITVSAAGNTLQGHLHPAQLVQPDSKTSVVPLFHSELQGIQGKVKLALKYTTSSADSDAIGRQTTQDLLLPKSGQLHYSVSAEVDAVRLKQTLALPPEDTYLQLTLDIFGSSPQLAPHFPPVSSPLTLPSWPLKIEGTVGVTLSANVLQHFRSGTWSLSLSAVYYSKEGGNYQCKQAVLGTSSAPLLSAIKPSGLAGDYALKNRLGMFLGVSQVALSYRKKTALDRGGRQTGAVTGESTWLILQFTEVVNFEQELNWVKLEVLHQGKRIASERQSLKGLGALPCNCKSILLQLPPQELATTKILPVRVTTGQGLFAIDINLRPISQHLSNNKSFAQGAYFLVVDSQARPTRIRIAAKVIALKGNHTVAPLAEGLASHPPLSLPPQLNDYPSKAEILRKHLQLPARMFEEACSSLLPDSRQELPALLFHRVLGGLELTPISCEQPEMVQDMAMCLTAVSCEQQVVSFLRERQLGLLNFRREFLSRFSFGKLNASKIDQNVEYLGLNEEIDTIVFVKTIKIVERGTEEGGRQQNEPQKGVLLTIVKGNDFHLLYNGITPNPLLSLPTLHSHSQPQTRTQHPLFNLALPLKHIPHTLPIEVYHSPGQDDSDILIGEGSINLKDCLNKGKTLYRVPIISAMSSRMQAGIDVKVEPLQEERKEGSMLVDEGEQKEEGSVEDEAIQAALARLKEDRRPKEGLFESSDEDY